MTFDAIDALVGGLPESASGRTWWANTELRPQASSGWLAAGRRVDSVDLHARAVTFTAPGARVERAPGAAVRPRKDVEVPPPLPVTLTEAQVAGLERFLGFRGASKSLRDRIAQIETAVSGLDAIEAQAAVNQLGVDRQLMEGALLVKALAAQVDVVLHASGILQALPHILQPDESVESVSLGAGNTGRDYDLETDQQIAEFKFINWQGGAETVRQDSLLIDVFNLAQRDTDKRRVLYLTGTEIPLRWLTTSKRVTRDCLARRSGVPGRFDARYGDTEYHHVRDYWAAAADLVEIVDLNTVVPGLAAIDDPSATTSDEGT